MKEPGSKKIRQKTVVEQVMGEIRTLLANQQYKTNDQIPTEGQLAEMFGVGRPAIREAVKVFNYLGVLESHPAKGTFVCDSNRISREAIVWSAMIGKKDFSSLLEIRGAFEVWSMISIIQGQKADQEKHKKYIEAQEDIISRMSELAKKNNYNDFIDLDYEFHMNNIRYSGNDIFEAVINTMNSSMFKEINIVVHKYDLFKLTEVHKEIIDFLRESSLHKAITAIIEHINNISKLIESEL